MKKRKKKKQITCFGIKGFLLSNNSKKEKRKIIERLKSNDKNSKLYHSSIPIEYQFDDEIIDVERKIGIRVIKQIGFDVIKQSFFVKEKVLDYDAIKSKEVWKGISLSFASFDEFYDYLNGNIYENACYYQCDFANTKKRLDLERLYKKNSLIDYVIDDFTLSPTEEEEAIFNERERIKKQIKRWVSKFNDCDSLESLRERIDLYSKSVLNNIYNINVKFFLWQYVFYDLNDKNRFKIIMDYMSTGLYPACEMIKPLCHVFEANEVLAAYNYSSGAKQTRDKHNKELKKYVESINNMVSLPERRTRVFFSTKTHYYYEKDTFGVFRFFETFEELLRYRNNDLRNADLREDIKLDYDFSACKVDTKTILPIRNESECKYVVRKSYYDGKFVVLQAWVNKNGREIKRYFHEFDYFFDFVSFLKGDLSETDLLQCDGLKNLVDASAIDFTDAIIKSDVCDKLGIRYNQYSIEKEKILSFEETKKNERDTELVLDSSRDKTESQVLSRFDEANYDATKEKIYYISDLHLMHKLEHFRPKSKADVEYVIQTIAKTIADESGKILLIGGDVASDYNIFELFLRRLRIEFDRCNCSPLVIMILGNHELWDFQNKPLEKIIDAYRNLAAAYGMYLLHNNIIYRHSYYCWDCISTDELKQLSVHEIHEKLRTAEMIFFGGLAFSGCNENFNAYNGIYRETINRCQEIEESEKYDTLYKKIISSIPDREVVIFSHTPMDCWSKNVNYQKNYVYVSGHTHKNQFYDDDSIRVYADNQIGYKNNNPHLKWFLLNTTYDYFSDYDDGIYEITRDDYLQFYRGKNKMISFTRKINILYMLKKNQYYCFIHQSKSGLLSILNGGRLSSLGYHNIKYYYDNMDAVIAMINNPLEKYTSIQKQVSAEIRKIGGDGRIHGCIVDIDFFNHVYINPEDLKITAYWASDMVNKKVYPNIPLLLEMECPSMYSQYKKLLQEGDDMVSILSNEISTDVSVLPQQYLDTDIYKASREISKMQRLDINILTTWYDIGIGNINMIELKK